VARRATGAESSMQVVVVTIAADVKNERITCTAKRWSQLVENAYNKRNRKKAAWLTTRTGFLPILSAIDPSFGCVRAVTNPPAVDMMAIC